MKLNRKWLTQVKTGGGIFAPRTAVKKEGTTYWMGTIFVYGFLIYIVLLFIFGIAYVAWAATHNLTMIDTGYSYQFQFPIGYSNITYDIIPGAEYIVSEKVFIISFLVFVTLGMHIPLLFLLLYVRKILRLCEISYSPFVMEAAKNVKCAAKLIIGMGFFTKLIIQMGTSAFACRQPYFENPIDLVWVFAGVILLIVSDIFERGCHLQQDADETL